MKFVCVRSAHGASVRLDHQRLDPAASKRADVSRTHRPAGSSRQRCWLRPHSCQHSFSARPAIRCLCRHLYGIRRHPRRVPRQVRRVALGAVGRCRRGLQWPVRTRRRLPPSARSRCPAPAAAGGRRSREQA